MGIEDYITFIITALFFIMTPGIDTVFILNKSISQGVKSGVYAMLGVNTGVLIHTFFAAIGLSVLIAKSVFMVAVIKYVGAVYLVYLGFLKFKNKDEFLIKSSNILPDQNIKKEYWSGFITNTLNPKVALFFLAFFPQFIHPMQIENPIPFIVLGCTYAIIGMVWFLILIVFASVFAGKLKDNSATYIWINRLSGGVFIWLGVKIALTTI